MRSISIPPLSANMTVMTRAVFKASKRLIRDFHEVENLQISKKGPKDFVTNADIASEKILIAELQHSRPTYGFVTEESGVIAGTDQLYRWIIDPIDGTVNFVHSFPFWCISLALEKAGEVIAAIVFDPLRNELFWAEKGAGAFLNDRRIRVNNRRELSDALVVAGKLSAEESDKLKNTAVAVRKLGSAALSMAYIASGRSDVYIVTNPLNCWDIAAGYLLIKEAGGSISDINGKSYKKLSAIVPSIVASNIDLCEKSVNLLR